MMRNNEQDERSASLPVAIKDLMARPYDHATNILNEKCRDDRT